MRTLFFMAGAILGGWASMASAHGEGAEACPGHPDALGTSRVILVDPAEHRRIGSMQYEETLPLADHEVVLSFDDGPSVLNTPRVLDILAAECVKATFFIVGDMAAKAPAIVKRMYDEGHTIGSHTQNHPYSMRRLSSRQAQREIDEGIASTTAAIGDPGAVAPFFRIPGLDRSKAIEAYASSRGLMVWSADLDADDWTRISPAEVVKRTLKPLERRGRGLIELHDIHERTASALPKLLAQFKRRGYHMVHVKPVRDGEPKTAASAKDWRFDP